MPRNTGSAALATVLLALLPATAAHAAAAATLDYNRDVRPILAENCFHCHGQDPAKRKAKLRLDERDVAVVVREGRAAIVPGKPTSSELITRITTSDADDLMPPADSHRKLTAEQITTLTRWIAEGAPYQRHWAFTPPVAAKLPTVPDAAWARSPIDRFIAARLATEGLKPSPPTTPATWLRRASIDLIGLPASPAETDAFIADLAKRGESAYADAVDRLLASPRYGERQAQQWLDVARYADSHGFNNDSTRSMWRWRDWVIDACNADLPYDRFITAQLAGDLLPAPTSDDRLATGFCRNHVINSEGGIISEEYRVEYVADRVRTLGMAWLGLTLECARCHDHKYDPLTQRDYFKLFALFNQVDEVGEDGRVANAAPLMAAPTRVQQVRLAALDAGISAEDAALAALRTKAAASPVPWEELSALSGADPAGVETPTVLLGLKPGTGEVVNLVKPEAKAFTGPLPSGEADVVLGTVLAVGDGPELAGGQIDLGKDWSFSAWVRWEGGAAPLFSAMNYRAPPAAADHGRGNDVRVTDDGRIEVRRSDFWPGYSVHVMSAPALTRGTWHHVVVTCSEQSLASAVRVFVDGREPGNQVLRDDLRGKPGGTPHLGADSAKDSPRFTGRLAGVRFHQRLLDPRVVATWSEGLLIRLLQRERDNAPAIHQRWVRDLLLRQQNQEFAAHWQRREALWNEKLALGRELPTAMVMADMATPRPTNVLIRGQYDQPGEAVEPGVPDALGTPWPSGAPRNRLGLAAWLTRADHPLTGRVVVNRVWQQLFGTGLVKTAEDFGRQGEFPSHPELLDWLARRFVDGGWKVKVLLKELVLSATYRQASALTPALRERDPEGRLFARYPRHRLDAEVIRDLALAHAGLLRHRLGGPSVFPYQPEDLYKNVVVDAPYPGTVWTVSSGDDLYRRSLYTYWKRTVPHPVMSGFDVPDREACTARRARTNTPLQALTMMNETGFVEAARGLGALLLREGGADDRQRLAFGFRLVTGRAPADAELSVLDRALIRLRGEFTADPAAADRWLKIGASPTDPALPQPDLAAYAAVASLLLNLDATITKD